MRDPGVRVGKVLEEGSSGQAGRWVLRERGVERGYGSARARTEQSRERGEDPGRRKGKDLTRGPGLSVGDATSAGCGLSGVRGAGSWAPGVGRVGRAVGPRVKERKGWPWAGFVELRWGRGSWAAASAREQARLQEKEKGVAGPAWKRSGPAKEMMRRPGWAASWVLGWVGVGFGLVWVFCFLLLFSISKQIKSN